MRHKKVHARAAEFIREYIDSAKMPVQIPALVKALRDLIGLRISSSSLRLYLRERLSLRYKRLGIVSVDVNRIEKKL